MQYIYDAAFQRLDFIKEQIICVLHIRQTAFKMSVQNAIMITSSKNRRISVENHLSTLDRTFILEFHLFSSTIHTCTGHFQHNKSQKKTLTFTLRDSTIQYFVVLLFYLQILLSKNQLLEIGMCYLCIYRYKTINIFSFIS